MALFTAIVVSIEIFIIGLSKIPGGLSLEFSMYYIMFAALMYAMVTDIVQTMREKS